MKLGVYVGSFNPPHNGHKKIIDHLINKYLDKVIVTATGNYWNKTNLIDVFDRIMMLKKIQNDNIIIDEENNNVEYTYQILENLHKKYNQDELYLIIGADNLVKFNEWKNFETILNYNIIIMNRDNINSEYYLKKHNIRKAIIIRDFPLQDISSTTIRKLIKEKDYTTCEKYVDKEILNYIIENKLFK